MRYFLTGLILSSLLVSCTSAELEQVFPPTTTTPTGKAGRITVTASNPGEGGTPCATLNVNLSAAGTLLGTSPDLTPGGQWAKTLTSADFAGATTLKLTATCEITTTDASGNTSTVTGLSISEHPVTDTDQTITVTGPRLNENLTARKEWATPVPGVLPLDP